MSPPIDHSPSLPPPPAQLPVAVSKNFSSSRKPPAHSPFSVEDRMVLSTMGKTKSTTNSMGPLFSFRAQAMPLVDALALFARTNKLNIVAGPDIRGEITVDFHDLSLDRAMAALLEVHGYYWERDEQLIQVRRLETRVFHLDYIRLVRGGSGRNKAQITSGSGGSGPQGGTSSHDAGEITVNQKVQIKFWEELETQVKSLMSQEGRLVINYLSGTIQVTDQHHGWKRLPVFSSRSAALCTVKLKSGHAFMKSTSKMNTA